MAGKGDKRRQGDSEKLISNWDRIFNKGKKSSKVDTSEVEPYHINNARHLKMKDIALQEKKAEEKRRREQELFDRLDREVEEENESK